MSRFRKWIAGLGITALLWGAVPLWAATPAEEIRKMMGENFQNVQLILSELITANYQSLPQQIGLIRDHAIDISKKIPPDVTSEMGRKLFTTYAFTLENKSNNMITVLNELIKHDQATANAGQLNIDYLRVVAAQHFGEIVTTCVLCHNQFRRKVVK